MSDRPSPDTSAADTGRGLLVATSRRAWRHAMALAVVGLACALLLSGLSAWFLGAVAIEGLSSAAFTFNFHIPGALVRLFAIGRTVARYGERLAGHKAALLDQVVRRSDLFVAMASARGARDAGWQFGDPARLSDYLDDVEDLDFGRLRVGLPVTAGALGAAAVSLATLLTAPLAMAPIAALLLVWAVLAQRMTETARRSIGAAEDARRQGAEAAGAALAAIVPLRAEGAWASTFDASSSAFAQAESGHTRLRIALARFDAVSALVGPAAGGCVVAGAWFGGARGEALLWPVFVAFAWLALSEVLQSASRAIVAALRRDRARDRIAAWSRPMQPPDEATLPPQRPATLLATEFRLEAPDGRELGPALSLAFRRGDPTVLVGASGSGKTSLLKQIGGWTGGQTMTDEHGAVLAAGDRRALAMLCPHDAAILADTVRANVFAPHAADDDLWRALAAVELDGRIRAAGGLDAWITQDALSLGEAQRLNLARAWLSARPLLLLDEPSEHLDHAQGERILQRLLTQLRDRIVVMSSHRGGAWPAASRIDLDTGPSQAAVVERPQRRPGTEG